MGNSKGNNLCRRLDLEGFARLDANMDLDVFCKIIYKFIEILKAAQKYILYEKRGLNQTCFNDGTLLL